MAKIKLFTIITANEPFLYMDKNGAFVSKRITDTTKFFSKESHARACIAGKIRAGNFDFNNCSIEIVKAKFKFYDMHTASENGVML